MVRYGEKMNAKDTKTNHMAGHRFFMVYWRIRSQKSTFVCFMEKMY
tara:strand:+ start:3152 stop:3289 length:138 start_codon:yes stop_codon:yes gene_type:complete